VGGIFWVVGMVRGGENDPPPIWSTCMLEEVYMWFLDEAQVKESWIEAIRDVKHVNERFPAILLPVYLFIIQMEFSVAS
jgi:hypothetical protein